MPQIIESKLRIAAETAGQLAASGASKEGRPTTGGEQNLPTVAGDWRLEGLLGEGALARVFRATPAASPRGSSAAYAIKMLRPQWEDHAEAIDLLRREAKVGRDVTHPHVVPVLAGHLTEAPYFVVMPRLVGQTLAARLTAGPLTVGIAIWIARQVAQALDALHQRGYLHGDVKPANLVIAPSGHVTLIDLGFARRPDETGSAVNRLVLGTINYLAPELLVSAIRADLRSDIFSLGVVLFEMLSGRAPVAARNLSDLLQMHNEYRAPNLRAIRADMPAALSALVRQMLFREPLRRPHSMSEVVDRLVRLEIETFADRAA
jgi:serine/threonine-protein kinase